jgi:hypothetical protein
MDLLTIPHAPLLCFLANIHTIHLFKRLEKSMLYFSIIMIGSKGPDYFTAIN